MKNEYLLHDEEQNGHTVCITWSRENGDVVVDLGLVLLRDTFGDPDNVATLL